MLQFTLAPGTFTGLEASEIELFKRLLSGMTGIGVEIGCLDGFSSTIILGASELHLTSIDPFVPDSMEASLIGQEERYHANVAPYVGRSRLLRTYSQHAILEWQHPLDFLFIDGDHNYAAVLQDFEQWACVLKKGGILAIHDSRMSRPGGAGFHVGPSKVAELEIYGKPEQWEILGEAFSLTVARKLY